MPNTIAIVLNTSWNIYNFRLGLIKALQKEGWRVIAIAPTDAYTQKLKNLGIEHHNIIMNNKGVNPIEEIKLTFDFFKLYKKLSPDIILQYTIKPNIYGSIASSLLGIPAISNITGLGTVFLNEDLSSKIARLLYRVALKIPKKVFFQNIHDKELFVSSRLVKASKTYLLPGSGIDINQFKSEYNGQKDKGLVRFLFIARLVKDKGLVEFVDAAREITKRKKINKSKMIQDKNIMNVEFNILGSFYPGNPTAITEDVIQKWEAEGIINYLGENDDVKSILNNHDCIVLPSYREGLSRVLLEAASMGKPIVTTDVPGCKEVVDDGVNGFLCPVKDVDCLVDKMEKILFMSQDQRHEMGRKGREKVIVSFKEEIVIQQYKSAIQSII